MTTGRQNLNIQKWVVSVAVLLFIIKVVAYFFTRSVAIMNDALESTVNVVAGFIGLYSLYIAAQPRDENHPYGHGKAEFLSAAVEGTLISIAGLVTIYAAVENFFRPEPLHELDTGIILVGITAVINFIVGYISIRQGKKNHSLALIASGRHLQTDTWSTLGLMLGLGLILLTGQEWLDSVVALIFAVIILVTGYRILRHSVAGIMDEADKELLTRMLHVLNANRRENWIDLHNLRVIKYGGTLHIDCHLTVPWYLNVIEAHKEVEELGALIRREFGNAIELFVHTDPCLEISCPICTKDHCAVRQKPFQRRIEWTLRDILTDKKHSVARMNAANTPE